MSVLKFAHYQSTAARKGFKLTRNNFSGGYCATLAGGACVNLRTDSDMIGYVNGY